MSISRGIVRGDGTSTAVPEGIYDMAAAADDMQIHPELEKKLEEMFLAADVAANEIKAKFKLEVMFAQDRSLKHPYLGIVTAWTNGGFLHGGGDEAVYFCPQKVPRLDGSGDKSCAEPLSLKFISRNVALCPKCGRPVHPKALAGQVIAKLTTDGWTTLMIRMFRSLECNADLRIGTLHGDLRRANEVEMDKERRGDDYGKVRHSREWIAYPLRSIVKDTSSGSDLHTRFKAFLSA